MSRMMVVMTEEGGDGFAVNPEHIRAVKREGDVIAIDVGGGIGYTMTTKMNLEDFVLWWELSLEAGTTQKDTSIS